MADYATLLREHVTLTCRSVDRIFLQGYVPKLQTVGWVCQFLRWQRGFKTPSSAAFGCLGEAYVAAVHRFAEDNGVPVVRFVKGENKEQIARPRARANRRSVTGRSPVDTPGADYVPVGSSTFVSGGRAASSNSRRGCWTCPSDTTSRRKNSASVQSATTRTLRFSVGIRLR